MAERDDTQYDETDDPHNPPESVTNRHVRREALWSFLGPVIVLAVILGLAMIYWGRREPGREIGDRNLNPAIGTTGDQPKEDNATPDFQQGGGDPARRPDSTADELKQRGAGR